MSSWTVHPEKYSGAEPRQVSPETAAEPAVAWVAPKLVWDLVNKTQRLNLGVVSWQAACVGLGHAGKYKCSRLSCEMGIMLSCAWRSLRERCYTCTSPAVARLNTSLDVRETCLCQTKNLQFWKLEETSVGGQNNAEVLLTNLYCFGWIFVGGSVLVFTFKSKCFTYP